MESDYIGVKTPEHLRSRLAADATIDTVSSKEVRPTLFPCLGDGVAHESALGTAQDLALLKAMDRAFWVRYVAEPSNVRYAVSDCGYFRNPSLTQSLPVVY